MTTTLGERSRPQVSELQTPGSNGMSSETILFDATWRDGDTERAESLVARLAPDPANAPVFPTYDLDKQFNVMRVVARTRRGPGATGVLVRAVG